MATTPTYWPQFCAARPSGTATISGLYQEARALIATGLQNSRSLTAAGTLPLWLSIIPLLYATEDESRPL